MNNDEYTMEAGVLIFKLIVKHVNKNSKKKLGAKLNYVWNYNSANGNFH